MTEQELQEKEVLDTFARVQGQKAADVVQDPVDTEGISVSPADVPVPQTEPLPPAQTKIGQQVEDLQFRTEAISGIPDAVRESRDKLADRLGYAWYSDDAPDSNIGQRFAFTAGTGLLFGLDTVSDAFIGVGKAFVGKQGSEYISEKMTKFADTVDEKFQISQEIEQIDKDMANMSPSERYNTKLALTGIALGGSILDRARGKKKGISDIIGLDDPVEIDRVITKEFPEINNPEVKAQVVKDSVTAKTNDEVADIVTRGIVDSDDLNKARPQQNVSLVNTDKDQIAFEINKKSSVETQNLDAEFDAKIQKQIIKDTSADSRVVSEFNKKVETSEVNISKAVDNIEQIQDKIIDIESKVSEKIFESEFGQVRVAGLERQLEAAQGRLVKQTQKITEQRVRDVAQLPAGNIKKYINDNIVNKTSIEKDMLVDRLKLEQAQAFRDGRIKDVEKITDAINDININSMNKLDDIESNIVEYEKTIDAEVDDMYNKESALEYSISKVEEISNEMSFRLTSLNDKLSTLSKAQLVDLHNRREQGLIKAGDEMEGINNEITEVTKRLNDIFENFDLLDERFDEDTYIRTQLQNIDGTPANVKSLNRLRADSQRSGNASLKELLSRPSDINKALKNKRKYITADDRDVVLAEYGLRTVRDPQVTVINHIAESKKLIDKLVLSNTLRQVAVSGKRADQIVELYNPKDLQKFRTDLQAAAKKSVDEVLDVARAQKILNADSVSSIKLLFRDLKKFDVNKDDPLSLMTSDTAELDSIFDNIIRQVDNAQSDVKSGFATKIEALRQNYKDQLIDRYAKLADEADDLEKQGFKNITGVGHIRGSGGLYAFKVDNKIKNPLKSSPYDYIYNQGIIMNKNNPFLVLDQAQSYVKFMRATLDFFLAVPAYWNAATLTNPYRASVIFVNALRGSANDIPLERRAFLSQFIKTGKQNIGDIDAIEKRLNGDIAREQNIVDSLFESASTVAEKARVKGAFDKIKTAHSALESLQFDTLVDGIKLDVLEMKGKELMRKNGISEREAYIEAGKIIDAEIGLVDFKKLEAKHPNIMGKGVQTGLRLLLFAPSLFMSLVKRVANSPNLFKGGAKGSLARERAIKKVVYGFGALTALNMSMNDGKTTFENDDPDRIFDLQVPFITDEQGNPYYINIMGRMFDSLKLINQTGKTFRNKQSGISGTVIQSLFPNYFQKEEGNVILNAVIDNNLPVPFGVQEIGEGMRGLLNDEDDEYGVPQSAEQLLMLSMITTMGAPGSYITGNSKKESALNIAKEALAGVESGNWSRYLSWEMGYNVFTNRDKIGRQEVIKDRYEIESVRFQEETDYFKVKEMDQMDREDFMDNLSESSFAALTKWELAELHPDATKAELGKLMDNAGIGGKPGKATKAQIEAHQLKVLKLQREEITQRDTEQLGQLLEAGQISQEIHDKYIDEIGNQFLTENQLKVKNDNAELDRLLESGEISKEVYDKYYKE